MQSGYWKSFQILNIILVRGLGLNTDVSQLQSAWEPEKCKKKNFISPSISLKHMLSKYICPEVLYNREETWSHAWIHFMRQKKKFSVVFSCHLLISKTNRSNKGSRKSCITAHPPHNKSNILIWLCWANKNILRNFKCSPNYKELKLSIMQLHNDEHHSTNNSVR